MKRLIIGDILDADRVRQAIDRCDVVFHLAARVAILFATEQVDQWRGCLVVATEHKVRVKRPV